MVDVVYKLVGFDRETERLAVAYEIPDEQVTRAKQFAGIADRPEIIGAWDLTTDQAAQIADMIDQKIDLRRNEYFLEPYSASNLARAERTSA